jgi:hypothetical protein
MTGGSYECVSDRLCMYAGLGLHSLSRSVALFASLQVTDVCLNVVCLLK